MDSENVSETMLCPICLDIPPEAVFLCVNGHTICCKCCSTVERCPECRVPYKMGKIRNRVLETLLDDLELQCPYAAFGCPDKFGRGKLQSHANTCIFKDQQAIKLVPLCKKIGYASCRYLMQSNDKLEPIIEHLANKHGFLRRQGYGVTIQLENFGGVVPEQDSMWTPVLLSLQGTVGGPMFVIWAQFAKEDMSIAFLSLYLGGRGSAYMSKYETEFQIQSKTAEIKEFAWRVPLVTISTAVFFLATKPTRVPFTFLREHFMNHDDGCLSMNVSIVTRNRNKQTPTNTNQQEVTSVFTLPLPVLGNNDDEDTNRKADCQCASQLASSPTLEGTKSSDDDIELRRTMSSRSGIKHVCQAQCVNCDRIPVVVYYKCMQCADFNLCSHCIEWAHPEHAFVKIDSDLKNAAVKSLVELSDGRRIISCASDTGIPSRASVRFTSATCDSIIHSVDGNNPVASFTCLQCPQGIANLCDTCVMNGTHKDHLFAVTNSNLRRHIISTQMALGLLPLQNLELRPFPRRSGSTRLI